MDDGTYESAPARRTLNPLEVTGQLLAVAAALIVLAGVFYAWAIEDTGWRRQLEVLSSFGAGILTAMLALGGILALYASRSDRIERIQPFWILAQLVGGLVILLAIASSISTLTESSDVPPGVGGPNEMATKLSDVLPRISALLVGAIILIVANSSTDE